MAIYECLFFKEQRIVYWEYLEADGDHAILALLEKTLAEEDCETAEAWRGDVLVCRAVRPDQMLSGSASRNSAD